MRKEDTIIINVDAVLVQAAITKFHRWSALNNRHLFLTFLEVEKLKIKLPTNLVSEEGPASRFRDSCHLATSSHDKRFHSGIFISF